MILQVHMQEDQRTPIQNSKVQIHECQTIDSSN